MPGEDEYNDPNDFAAHGTQAAQQILREQCENLNFTGCEARRIGTRAAMRTALQALHALRLQLLAQPARGLRIALRSCALRAPGLGW